MSDNLEDAVTHAANEQAAAAEAASNAAKAETIEHIAAASESATAAAHSAKALAETNAAEIISQHKDDMAWLKTRAQETENSLNEMRESHQRLASSIPETLEKQNQSLMENLSKLLTPVPPPQSEGQTVTVIPENGEEEGHGKTGAKKTRKRSWL